MKILINFKVKNCFNIFLIPQNFFRYSPFFQNINFFRDFRQQGRWEKIMGNFTKILINFKVKNYFNIFLIPQHFFRMFFQNYKMNSERPMNSTVRALEDWVEGGRAL